MTLHDQHGTSLEMLRELREQREQIRALVAGQQELTHLMHRLIHKGPPAAGGSPRSNTPAPAAINPQTSIDSELNKSLQSNNAKPPARVAQEKAIKSFAMKQAEEEVYGMHKRAMNRQPTHVGGQVDDKSSLLHRRLHFLFVATIPPESTFVKCWKLLVALLALWIAIALPPQLAFNPISDADFVEWTGYSVFQEVCFWLDIWLSLRISYVDNDTGEAVTDPRKVAGRYARLRMLVDLAATLPFERMVVDGASALTPDTAAGIANLQVVRTLRFLRLLRFYKFWRFMTMYGDQLHGQENQSLARMVYLTVSLIFYAHWVGCVQYFVATVADAEFDYARGSGVVLSEETWVVRAGIDGEDAFTRWSWCLYHSMMQVLGVTDGVNRPRLISEVWLYTLSCAGGATLYAIFVASLTAVFGEYGASARKYRAFMDEVHKFSRHYGIPREKQARIVAYFKMRYPRHNHFDESMITSALSHPLRNELALFRSHSALAMLQVLHDESLSRALAASLLRVLFVHGDTIIHEGEPAPGIFFIEKGKVNVMAPKEMLKNLKAGSVKNSGRRSGEEFNGEEEERVIRTLTTGSFFGEMATMSDSLAKASVRCFEDTEGFQLTTPSYRQIVMHWPHFRDYLETVARLRTENTNAKGEYQRKKSRKISANVGASSAGAKLVKTIRRISCLTSCATSFDASQFTPKASPKSPPKALVSPNAAAPPAASDAAEAVRV